MTSSGYQFTTRSFQGVPVHVKRRMINCTDEEVSMETVPIMSLKDPTNICKWRLELFNHT